MKLTSHIDSQFAVETSQVVAAC